MFLNIFQNFFSFPSPSCMAFTEWFSSFHKETLALQILFAQRAVEALRMIVIVESLNPPIACLYGESARDAFCCEQLVPIFFAVRQAVLKIERGVCKDFTTIGTGETFGMEALAHGFQTVLSFYFCRNFVKGTLDELLHCQFYFNFYYFSHF